ncbi:hypothetical protein KDU71_11090 [Carboxylicivirga sediminis]|uniref:Uncharacterized protein n=1 Tax=Carboxylicivirga sediminis TaxID=2006564 RepID=A0A941F3H0_9BACT|nr:hypothetical protein [Carboxylicivirga sediminis]MBR8536103.1 hypothetical protein [Carboxylicivirga sediminis]
MKKYLVSILIALVKVFSVTGQEVEVYSVDLHQNAKEIADGVNGLGMLDRCSTSEFAKSSQYTDAIKNYGAGSLRWPSAGHDNLLITHWDNNHTTYYGKTNPYRTKAAGNIWDQNYDINNSAPRNEMIDLDAFVDVLKTTNAKPIICMTWRSGELYSYDENNNRLFYRDPEPYTLHGELMTPEQAAKLSSREMQFLENRRFLKRYFELGGPDYPVIQVGGEIFIGWDDNIYPWKLVNKNKGEWLAETIQAYINDADSFAKELGKNIQWMVQFKECEKGGTKIPTPVKFLRGELDKMLDASGDDVSFLGCSMHYRRSWNQWLDESDMTFGFIADQGMGNTKQIYNWLTSYCESKGYPGIQLIPHANGIDTRAKESKLPDYTTFQIGLVNTQFVMELTEAGFPYACFYGGIKGNYEGNIGLKDNQSISYTKNGEYRYNPILYSTGLIGEGIRQVNEKPSKLFEYQSKSGNTEAKTQVFIVEPSAKMGSCNAEVPKIIYAYLLNKKDVEQKVKLNFNEVVEFGNYAKRFSENEITALELSDFGKTITIGGNQREMEFSLQPLSLTMVQINVKTGNFDNRIAPRFQFRKRKIKTVNVFNDYEEDLNQSVTNPENCDLRFEKVTGPSFVSIDAKGKLRIDSNNAQEGRCITQVTVSDGKNTDTCYLYFNLK